MQTLHHSLSVIVLLSGLTAIPPAIHARNKTPKAPSSAEQDEIQVAGHIPLAGSPVARFLTTQHYSSYYLYAERGDAKGVTLIDVTNAARPAVLADLPYSSDGGADSLAAVAGTAALVASGAAAPASVPAIQTLRIMDFSDPRSLKVAREFTGVTAITRDDRRGLIFVANTEGIWILKQHLAEDPEVQKAYANYVLYSH
jgi:hypothetical protein